MKINIVGCGLAGIVTAVLLKNKGHEVIIFETRNHIGGNCYDTNIAGTMTHCYGPHIFHTDDQEVFNFLSQYTEWIPFELRPKGNTDLGLISLPYSKTTIREIGRELSLEEIQKYIFKGYSEKQWGIPFEQIPPTIINRIPKTKDFENPTWFEGQKYQCIPKYGYTEMFKNMLHKFDIRIKCDKNEWRHHKSDLTIYTGKIDEYFNYCYGALPYRSLEFIHRMSETKMKHFITNHNTPSIPSTRTYDQSHFTLDHKGPTIITEEFAIEHNENNIPFYPIPLEENIHKYNRYAELIEKEKNIKLVGRLATYKYLDMWQAVRQAINITNTL